MQKLTAFCIGVGTLFSGSGCHRPQEQQDQPLQFYEANRCGGKLSGWSAAGTEYGELMAQNRIAAGPSSLTWNGSDVSAETIQSYLGMMRELNPRVNLQVVFDNGTDCRRVKQVRDWVARNVSCVPMGSCVEYSQTEYDEVAREHLVF